VSGNPATEPRDRVQPAERAEASLAQTRVALQVLLSIAGITLALWTLYELATVVLVLILAGLFAYVVAPLVAAAERPVRIGGQSRRLGRAAAIALVYLLLAGGVAAGTALLLPSATQQVHEIIDQAPAYTRSIDTWERGWSRYYERLRIPLELRRNIDRSVIVTGQALVESMRMALLALVGALSNLPWVVLIPILAFFFLKDAASVRRMFVVALPHHMRLHAHRFVEELNATMAAYIRAQLLACVLVGGLCGLGFALLGIPYPVVLGVLAALLEFIPLVGPLLLAVVAAVVGALHSPVLAVWAVGFLGGLRMIEDYVIYPRLIRRGISLHPVAVIVAVLGGAKLAGIAGMFLAVPVVAVAAVGLRHWLKWPQKEVVS
jgi:predicted PurR-regulated permease PerM